MAFKNGSPSHNAEFIANIRTSLLEGMVILLLHFPADREHHFKVNYYFVIFYKSFSRCMKSVFLYNQELRDKMWQDYTFTNRLRKAIRESKKQPPDVFYKKTAFKISQYSQENTVLEPLFNKVAGLQACFLLKRDSKTVNTTKFLRTPIWEAFTNCWFWNQ